MLQYFLYYNKAALIKSLYFDKIGRINIPEIYFQNA